ncbi:MAG: hypothetical protein IAG10_09780 [Planctomycetaceae bacterium]|nr:hypothetical protein [Planctomycetaceae bacterium]
MDTDTILREFSANRLGGEPVPDDLRRLLTYRDELAERTGIELNWDKDWAPWLDHSYLRPEERADAGIAANIRAMADVSAIIAFVAQEEDGQYFGLWRGLEKLPIAKCPLIFLDNEGQFNPCVSSNFAECVLEHTWGEQRFNELRDWFRSLGITIPFDDEKTLLAREWPKRSHEAKNLHWELQERYLRESK